MIVELDIVLPSGFQILGGIEATALQDLRDAAVEAFLPALVFGWRGGIRRCSMAAVLASGGG